MGIRLTGGRFYRSGRFIPGDVAFENGRLTDLSSENAGSFDISIPLKGAAILPGFVDVHVHLREPGFFYKESVDTGTLAAARGGFRAVCAMPNLSPSPDSLPHLKEEMALIRRDARVTVAPYGTLTQGRRGEGSLSDMEAMAPHVCGYSDDGVGLNDEALMRAAMEKAKALGKVVAAHCEDPRLIPQGGAIHQGAYARTQGIPGIPSASEYEPIARDLRLAKETGCAYHVCHVSCKESVALIRRAKAEGVDVTCETAPHYLLLCQDDLKDEGRFKMNPPLRNREDQEALMEGLADGTIDMIATDHAPHSAAEKAGGLRSSAMGVVGLETAFPLLYTYLVKTGKLSFKRLIALMAFNPARRFGLENGAADSFTVWDLESQGKVIPQDFVSKGRSTPFEGWPLWGKCLLTVANGEIAYQEGNA